MYVHRPRCQGHIGISAENNDEFLQPISRQPFSVASSDAIEIWIWNLNFLARKLFPPNFEKQQQLSTSEHFVDSIAKKGALIFGRIFDETLHLLFLIWKYSNYLTSFR
jgi:hypothetical protein